MKINDKISVIIPTYNREKLVVRSINSVLNQSYKNIEVIVVDDCSTDCTELEVKKIKDKRLKYIKLPKNTGACYARNVGISKATGKYIAFQDSDDVFRKNKLEKQLKNLKKNDSDLDFCKLKIHVGKNIYEFPSCEQDKGILNGNIIDELCKNNIISTQAILAKREIFDDEMFDLNLPRLQDYDLVLRILPKYKISYTKQILTDLYQQSDSISTSSDKLLNACFIMLRKDYNINNNQRNMLIKTLMSMTSRDEYVDLHDRYSELCINYGYLSNHYQDLVSNYQSLSHEYKKVAYDYEKLNKQYLSIINSKRWKYLSKFMKLFGK